MARRNWKNWNDLPENLKVECINKMEFRTMWTLRQTSRTEKNLVEGLKFHVTELAIVEKDNTRRQRPEGYRYYDLREDYERHAQRGFGGYGGFGGYEEREHFVRDARRNHDESLQQPADSKEELKVVIPSSKYRTASEDRMYLNVNEKTLETVRHVIRSVLKIGGFAYFEWTDEKPVSQLIQEAATEVPITVKRFLFKNLPILDLSILGNCQELEMVDVILRKENKTSFQELWKHWKPHIRLCNFSIKNVDSMEVSEVMMLIQKVIETDPKIDSRFDIAVLSRLPVDEVENAIKQKFGEAVSVWDEKELRIELGSKSVAVTYQPDKISISYKLTMKGRNWCDMPADVKRLCVRKMDFGTRWFLRYTARFEKKLAEEFRGGTFKLKVTRVHDTEKERLTIFAPPLELNMEFDSNTFETARSITRMANRMGNFGSLNCGHEEFFKEIISEIPEGAAVPVTSVYLKSVSRTDMHNMKKCRICSGVEVEFLKEDKITFAEVWQAWESMLPFGNFELTNVYSITVEEVMQLLDKVIESEPYTWAHFTVGLVNPFGERAALEAAIRRKFGNVSLWEGDHVRIHMGNDRNFSVMVGAEEVCIACYNDRYYR